MSVTANSILTVITAPGEVDDYLQATGPGDDLWTGSAPAYLKRARRGSQDQDVERKGATDILFVLDTSLAPILETAGRDDEAATVTVVDKRTGTAVTSNFTVLSVEHRAAGTSVDSVRLELDRETT